MSAIVVEGLRYSVKPHFWSRTRPILHGVSFAVEEGEVFGFLGPNGAGKTTTVKAMLGLLRQQAGTVKLFGRSPTEPPVRRRVGFMPERAYFPLHLQGRELLVLHGMLSGLSHGAAKRQAAAALDRVGLTAAANQSLGSYSKGMLQRAGLGQALVGDPDLLILDEPMSGLDPIGRRDVREIMVELGRAGKTVFFSTHILPDVELICDRIAILSKGRVHRVGELQALLGTSDQRIEVTAECSEVAAQEVQDRVQAMTTHRDAITFEVDSVERANEVVDMIRARGGVVRGMQGARGSLEDLFVQIANEGEVSP